MHISSAAVIGSELLYLQQRGSCQQT